MKHDPTLAHYQAEARRAQFVMTSRKIGEAFMAAVPWIAIFTVSWFGIHFILGAVS